MDLRIEFEAFKFDLQLPRMSLDLSLDLSFNLPNLGL